MKTEVQDIKREITDKWNSAQTTFDMWEVYHIAIYRLGEGFRDFIYSQGYTEVPEILYDIDRRMNRLDSDDSEYQYLEDRRDHVSSSVAPIMNDPDGCGYVYVFLEDILDLIDDYTEQTD